jgi:hypothetical protein
MKKYLIWTALGLGAYFILSKLLGSSASASAPLPAAVAANPLAYAIGTDTIRGKGTLLMQRWKFVNGVWVWTPFTVVKA